MWIQGSLESQRRWTGRVGRLRGPFPSSRGLCSLVCTARTGPSLTAWALEARSTEAGGGARPVHTGSPIEARGWREEAVRGWVLTHTWPVTLVTPRTGHTRTPCCPHQNCSSWWPVDFYQTAPTHPDQFLHPPVAQPQNMVGTHQRHSGQCLSGSGAQCGSEGRCRNSPQGWGYRSHR